MNSPTLRVEAAEGIPLAYALTARLAADRGIRLLAIKGTTLSHHGLRAPRVSADVDVILSPGDLNAFTEAMAEAGWRIAGPHENPMILGHHSVDLLNDHWPIGIDLHTFFPGFLAPAETVFDELWRRREELTIAGHPVQITDVASSAAVAALHHLRSPWRPENAAAFERLVEKSTGRLAATDLDSLADLARATGSVRTMGPFLERLGVRTSPVHPAEETEYQRWELGTRAHPYTAWWHRMREQPWHRRPGFLWRIVVLSPEEMRTYHGDRDPETPLWKLHVHRLLRIARALPETVRHELARRTNS